MSNDADVFTPQTVADLTGDSHNANRGTARGRKAIRESVNSLGLGRSILVDRQGRVIAGNKTLEAARGEGVDRLVVVQTDGSELVAVQRTDLDLTEDAEARELAVADNRTAQIDLDWDPDVLKMYADLGADLGPFFSAEELAGLSLAETESKRHAHGPRQPRAPSAPSQTEDPDLSAPNMAEGVPLIENAAFMDSSPLDFSKEKGRTMPGDTWLLGEHKLVIGFDEGRGGGSALIAWWERETGLKAVLGQSVSWPDDAPGVEDEGEDG